MIKGFIVTNRKKKISLMPIEDSFSINFVDEIFAVADGVTRDPYEFLPDVRTFIRKVRFSLGYPRPSPARIASNIFTRTFPSVLKDYNPNNRDEQVIKITFEEANKRIDEWNAQNMPNQDYILRDYAGRVAAGTSINKSILYLRFLTDCGVAIFDKRWNLRFRTENQGPDKYDKYIWQDERLWKMNWENSEARKIVRKNYRNNPSEEYSFGVLTGEETAMYYVRTSTQEIKPDEHLILYTNDLKSIIFFGEFANKLRQRGLQGLKRLCKENVRTEGTLIHYLKSF